MSPQGTVLDLTIPTMGKVSEFHLTMAQVYELSLRRLDVSLERNGSGDPVASYLRNPYAGGVLAVLLIRSKIHPLNILQL